jgi:hypothetical protein
MFKGVGVEIGVCEGEYSEHILKNRSVERLFSVDSWRHWGHNPDSNDVSDFEHACRARTALERLTVFGDRSVIVRASSEIASSLFLDGSLDFVYIDASHDYESVYKDLCLWFPKIKAGGIISGDDFVDGPYACNKRTTEFGVKRAVTEFFRGRYEVESNPYPSDFSYLPQWWVFG